MTRYHEKRFLMQRSTGTLYFFCNPGGVANLKVELILGPTGTQYTPGRIPLFEPYTKFGRIVLCVKLNHTLAGSLARKVA